MKHFQNLSSETISILLRGTIMAFWIMAQCLQQPKTQQYYESINNESNVAEFQGANCDITYTYRSS